MNERCVVVTGGASGIGEATSATFARSGARVIVLDVAPDGAADVVEGIRRDGGVAEAMTLDVADAIATDEVARACERRFGRVDVLVNCVGVWEFSPFEAATPGTWDRLLAVTLGGTLATCHSFGSAMVRAGRGKIVNVASTAGLFGVPQLAIYSAAKHGVVGLTRALAVEWAAHGVQVNCVAPGATASPALVRTTTEEWRRDRARRIPAGRFADPQDVALAIEFLASPAADHITGVVLPVDGGVAAMAPGTATALLHPDPSSRHPRSMEMTTDD